MEAFFNDEKIKQKYLKRVEDHRKADELIKGKYWENGKGCAVGCTIHSSDHYAYETELGIPRWLARVEDRIFEGLSEEESKKWPETFLKAIKPGVNLNLVLKPFLIFIVECASEKFDHKKFPKQAKKIKESLKKLKKIKPADAAAYAAYAAYAAAYAAYAAAYAAYAADAAADAAYAAADAAYAAYAADAADAAADAAYAAAYAAYAAAYAAGYYRNRPVFQSEMKKFADKLLELIIEL